jgi:hypothetical protein
MKGEDIAMKTYQGSCHCGAVRFEADIDLAQGTTRCNCSICSKARAWFTLVPPERVRLVAGTDAHTEYQWVPPGRQRAFLRFRFCKTCGIRTFGHGGDPAEKGSFCFINVAALDIDQDELAAAPIRYVDGRHDRYEQTPADTRLL